MKIFHTADVHLGMQFKSGRYPEEVRSSLIEARFETLARMVAEANRRKCDLFVIAGDLFDSLRIGTKVINRAAEIISGFTGEFVFVLPGNHDFIDADEDNVWKKFSTAAKEQLIVCDWEECRTYQLGDETFAIYPGVCRSKHSAENAIGWIADVKKAADAISIGIAHGAVAGLSPDNDDKYFLMSESDLADAKMDVWLLGHTHIFYPAKPGVNKPLFFMPATPEPDGLDCKHAGHAWFIEIDPAKNIRYEQIQTGKYRFYDISAEIASESDFIEVQKKWDKPENKNALMRLTLTGRISQDIYPHLQEFITEFSGLFLFAQVDTEHVRLLIDEAFIDKQYAAGSLPHILLKNIAEKAVDPSVLTLAYELVEGARQ